MPVKIKDAIVIDNVTSELKVPVGNSGNETQPLALTVGQIKTFVNSSLSNVAKSGSYNDLTNKPTIPAAQVNSDWNASSGVSQILNKPTIPTNTRSLLITFEDETTETITVYTT